MAYWEQTCTKGTINEFNELRVPVPTILHQSIEHALLIEYHNDYTKYVVFYSVHLPRSCCLRTGCEDDEYGVKSECCPDDKACI